MVNIKKLITAKYLTAKVANDLKGKTLIIDSAFIEKIKDEDKLCLRFKNVDLPMPLNQTNLTVLSAEFGEETSDWINRKVTLNIVKVSFQGELTNGIQLDPIPEK